MKSPFNYIGNKYRIIDQLLQYFPTGINNFVDLFCGGCDVVINTRARHRYANDSNYLVVDIFREMQKYTVSELLEYFDSTIVENKLSKEDRDSYIRFRKMYNENRNPLDLYVLMCFSFNYQFRFNSAHEFNNTFGRNRSSFNKAMRSNLKNFVPKIKNVHFSALDFRDFNFLKLRNNDFLYADPPYTLTCGSYNDGKRGFKGWNTADDRDLFDILDLVSDNGCSFALSNVSQHKGVKNEQLFS